MLHTESSHAVFGMHLWKHVLVTQVNSCMNSLVNGQVNSVDIMDGVLHSVLDIKTKVNLRH